MKFIDIYNVVNKIPSGSVASYGQVAKAAGMFRGAQIVGWALGSLHLDTEIPWHRVVNQKGILSITNPNIPKLLQKDLLENEGTTVTATHDGTLRLEEATWFTFE